MEWTFISPHWIGSKSHWLIPTGVFPIAYFLPMEMVVLIGSHLKWTR